MQWPLIADGFVFGSIVVLPWIFFGLALVPFRALLRRDWWILVGIGVATVLFFLQFLNPRTEMLAQADIHTTGESWYAVYRDSLRESFAAPLWNRYFGTGLPALGYPFVGYMTPLSVFLGAGSSVQEGVNVMIFAHLVLAATTMYLLARSIGLPRGIALFTILPFLMNRWLTLRFQPGVPILYLFPYAWLPLAWALLLLFVRTRSIAIGALVGVPLSFMAVSHPNTFVYTTFSVGIILLGTVLLSLFRKAWRAALLYVLGTVCLLGVLFATSAPEHVEAYTLLSANEGTRLSNPVIGWRIRDLTLREFLRVTFSEKIGERFFALDHTVEYFGVPYSPGEVAMLLGLFGIIVGICIKRTGLRRIALLHGVLLLLLFHLAVQGPLFGFLFRWYPFWKNSGLWPPIGAQLLIVLSLWSGVGLWFLLRALWTAGRYLHRLVQSRSATPRTATATSIRWLTSVTVFATFLLIVAEQLWGIPHLLSLRAEEKKLSREVLATEWRFRPFATVPLSDMMRFPHLAAIAEEADPDDPPTRLYCTGGTARWPSPCIDPAIPQYGLELLGVGDHSWSMPSWQNALFTHAYSRWEGTFTPLLTNLLRVGAVDTVVSTHELPFDSKRDIAWNDPPKSLEAYQYFARNVEEGTGPKEWDGILRLYEPPSGTLERATFLPGVFLNGPIDTQRRLLTSLLESPEFLPERGAVLETLPDREETPEQEHLPHADAATTTVDDLLHRFEMTKNASATFDTHVSRNGQWTVHGSAPNDGVLLLSSLWYPGFRASLNGARTPILRADGFLSAVPVKSGENTVELSYLPMRVILGSFFSLLNAFTLIFLLRREFAQKK